ncbi:MAG TPA: metallophosphoesterase [Polyangia bacterium]|jgi:3',5'-cyclic AMP phosphodiesterase CpdA|nr:metallophosphoesterase [Polyangia bacterium]
MFRLGHVTDPHFRGFSGARPGEFIGKRAIGALNLVVNRRRKHKMELLEVLRDDLAAQAVDHLALTGDLSNLSLEGEWREALRWLAAYGAPAHAVTVIPGNHDAYVQPVVTARRFEQMFAAFQGSDVGGGSGYPFVHLRGDVALLGVSSSVATGDLGAWGEVGPEQLARLEALLSGPELRGRTRVVLIHHPPVMQKGIESRNLRDRAALASVLARAGAELVIHGHDHRDEQTAVPGPGGRPIPIVGAGSASYAGAAERRARYNIYEIEGGRITVVTRAHDEAKGSFREVRRAALS